MNYLNITYEQLLLDFRKRLESDPRFKNIGSSSIYGMFQEMLLATMDMTNYYMQRTVEECALETARLDSSVIKLAKNLGYNPRRPIPAICELIIQLRGPLPSEIEAGSVIVFNQDTTDLSFNGNKFILDASYSYTLTEEDIQNGASSDWVKSLVFSVPSTDTRYIPLAGINYYNTNRYSTIKCFQAERKIVKISGVNNFDKIGKPGQSYDIDDVTFSNWYSKRDPFAFYNGNYIQNKSWTQIGIGASEEDAFKIDGSNLYDIEDQSIFLNEKLEKLTSVPTTPLKICQIDTNSDKTVKISFSPETTLCDIGLKQNNSLIRKYKKFFGESAISKLLTAKDVKDDVNSRLPQPDDQRNLETKINIGLTTDKDNIYVKYLSTAGKSANRTCTKNAIMSFGNKFYISAKGHIFDVTNNIQFIINSDIYGGDDFESQYSIKINAPAYFSSRGKLITHDDYISYFRALTSPINVQNALVYGEQELNDMYNVRHDSCLNNVFYCLFGHLYSKTTGDWYMKNVLTDINDLNDPVTIYGDEYKNHFIDYLLSIISYEAMLKKQKQATPSEQWVKNIQLINNNAKRFTEINSVMIALPPIVQYFDLVGTVKIKPKVDPQKYQKRLQNKVYEYLDNLAYKQREIYKSDIIGLYYEDDDTVSVDLDIKVSDIIKSDSLVYTWSKNGMGQDYEFTLNTALDSYEATIKTLKAEYGDNNSEYMAQFGFKYASKHAFNQIKIPKKDNFDKVLSSRMLDKRRFIIKYTTEHTYNAVNSIITTEANTIVTSCESYEDDDFVYLALPNLYMRGVMLYESGEATINGIPPHIDGVSKIEIYVPTNDDYFSTSVFGLAESQSYKLSGSDVNNVESDLNHWLNNLMKSESVNRVIPLPYTVYSNNTKTREETIVRSGNFTNTNYQTNLTEASFWRYFIKDVILAKYYDGTQNGNIHSLITDKTEYDSDEWKAARKLIMDLYPLVKPGICDSILDDNNNITNFSTPMEVAALRNCIDVISDT